MPPQVHSNIDEETVRRIASEAATQAVKQTLIALGVEHDSPIEMQKDFQHLRDWRKAGEEIKRKGLLTLVGIIVTGVAAAAWMAFKQAVR